MENKIKRIKSWHNQAFDIFLSMLNHRIVAAYEGPFDNLILVTLAQNFKEKLISDLTQAKKFFKIFIEVAHNISLYSAERENDKGYGAIIIQEFDDYFIINAANMVTPSTKEKLEQKLSLINSLNRPELRELKRKLRRTSPIENNSGNIGLVQTALISKHKLNYLFIPTKFENNQISMYFYIISVKIDKWYKPVQ